MSSALGLVADIGGTNARFALTDLRAEPVAISQPAALCSADFASLEQAAAHYLAQVNVRPRRAAIAVASPVGSDAVRLTNRSWTFSRRSLGSALGLDELRLLNDFGAVARAVPALQPEDCVHLYGPDLPVLHGPVTVIGPGTGLGVAVLVGSPDEGWQVVETEGGHVSFAPLTDLEERLARWISMRHGRASTERVLSGVGLSHIDAVIRGVEADPARTAACDLRDPARIVAGALDDSDPVARQALTQFCAILGSVTADAALIHGARTVMIAGGIVPRFLPFLRASAFQERFLAKGRFSDYLASIPVRVICHPQPGLLGAAVALREP
ncbi:MAG: glucokinase [Xanthomonadales bacterium]|nr:glucokinase [Xanthomonadales bacterium]